MYARVQKKCVSGDRRLWKEDDRRRGHARGMRRLLEKGWQTVYAPEAEILYYRNDNLRELWKRNFDIGVAHAEHPEMIENTKPGKEGMRLVRVTSALLKQNHMEEYLGEVAARSAVRYLAYHFGKHYAHLPEHFVRKCSANKAYWEKE